MKKFLLFFAAIILIAILGSVGQYNALVAGKASVAQALSDLQGQYQRRSDLVPQLVATVQGAANFEKSTITAVTEARAKATSMIIDPTNTKSVSDFAAVQSQLSGALSKLLVSIEAYPDLKANNNFRDLQSQLEGTENRISVARIDYNKVATMWNVQVSKFPTVILARLLGFVPSELFTAQPGAENAPKVEFK